LGSDQSVVGDLCIVISGGGSGVCSSASCIDNRAHESTAQRVTAKNTEGSDQKENARGHQPVSVTSSFNLVTFVFALGFTRKAT
jgi:hypothetical protein